MTPVTCLPQLNFLSSPTLSSKTHKMMARLPASAFKAASLAASRRTAGQPLTRSAVVSCGWTLFNGKELTAVLAICFFKLIQRNVGSPGEFASTRLRNNENLSWTELLGFKNGGGCGYGGFCWVDSMVHLPLWHHTLHWRSPCLFSWRGGSSSSELAF